MTLHTLESFYMGSPHPLTPIDNSIAVLFRDIWGDYYYKACEVGGKIVYTKTYLYET